MKFDNDYDVIFMTYECYIAWQPWYKCFITYTLSNKMPNWALSRKGTLGKTAMATGAGRKALLNYQLSFIPNIVRLPLICMIRYEW